MDVSPAPAARTSRSGSSVTSHGARGLSGIGMAVLRTQQREQMLHEISDGHKVLAEENGHMEEMLSEDHHMVSNADVCEILRNQFVGLAQSSILANRKSPVRIPCRVQRQLLKGRPVEQTESFLSEDEATRKVGEKRAIVGSLRGLLPVASSVPQTSLPEKHAPQQQQPGKREARAHGASPYIAPLAPVISNTASSINYRVMLEQQAEMNDRIKQQSGSYNELLREVVRYQQRIGEGIVEKSPEKKPSLFTLSK